MRSMNRNELRSIGCAFLVISIIVASVVGYVVYNILNYG